MPFHHIKRVWKAARRGVKHANTWCTVPDLDLRTIMKPPAHALIYDLVRIPRTIQDIPKGCKSSGGQWLGSDLDHAK